MHAPVQLSHLVSSDFEHLVRVEGEVLVGERLLAAVDQLGQDLPRVRSLQREQPQLAADVVDAAGGEARVLDGLAHVAQVVEGGAAGAVQVERGRRTV